MGSEADGFEEWWLVAGPVAVVGTVGCGVAVADSFAVGGRRLADGVVVAACLGAVPVLLLSIVTLYDLKRRRRDVLGLIESRAPAAWPVAALLFVLFWAFAGSAVAESEGDPRVRDGRYYVVNHGQFTEVSRERFERQETLHQRTLAGVAGALYAPGVCLAQYYYSGIGARPVEPRRRRRSGGQRHRRRRR